MLTKDMVGALIRYKSNLYTNPEEHSFYIVLILSIVTKRKSSAPSGFDAVYILNANGKRSITLITPDFNKDDMWELVQLAKT